ncbi:hypothetical protein BH11MYX2_BH11MYX2_11470 [soil metagenome]
MQVSQEVRSAFERSGAGDQIHWVMQGWFVAGQTRWPGVRLAQDDFVAWINERIATDSASSDLADELRGEELFLTAACMARDPDAMRALDTEIAAEVERVRPKRRDADAATELAQVLRDKLLVGEKLREYGGRSSLRRWLKMVALRTHLDLARSEGRRPTVLTTDGELGDLAATDDSPELNYLKAHYRDAVRRAFAAAARALPAEQRILVRQHHLAGITLDQLAEVYGIHRVTVARRLAAAREALGTSARELLAAEIALPANELESVLALVISKLDVSMHRLLE